MRNGIISAILHLYKGSSWICVRNQAKKQDAKILTSATIILCAVQEHFAINKWNKFTWYYLETNQLTGSVNEIREKIVFAWVTPLLSGRMTTDTNKLYFFYQSWKYFYNLVEKYHFLIGGLSQNIIGFNYRIDDKRYTAISPNIVWSYYFFWYFFRFILAVNQIVK